MANAEKTENKSLVNLILGCMVVFLGFCSIYFYLHDESPVIQPPAASSLPPGHPELPEDHPPIDYAKEISVLEQLSRNDPDNADYKTKIGNLYYDTGQYKKAVENYQKSLSLRPRDPSVETDMATAYHYLGQHDKALTILESVLTYNPNYAQALFNKGVILQAGKNDADGAILAWEELLRTNPTFPQRAALEQRMQQLKSAQR